MTTKQLLLFFPRSETEKPIIFQLVKKYDLEVNIFRAKITPEDEGFMVLNVTGTDEMIKDAIGFLESENVSVETNRKGVRWDSESCTQCGVCIVHCPTKALNIPDRTTMEVTFDANLCIECLSCIKICPFKACYSVF